MSERLVDIPITAELREKIRIRKRKQTYNEFLKKLLDQDNTDKIISEDKKRLRGRQN